MNFLSFYGFNSKQHIKSLYVYQKPIISLFFQSFTYIDIYLFIPIDTNILLFYDIFKYYIPLLCKVSIIYIFY